MSGLLGRTRFLKRSLDPSATRIDIALQFVEIARKRLCRKLHATGRVSKVYGGVWDRWVISARGTRGAYLGNVKPTNVWRIEVTKRQFEILTDDKSPHIALLGSRRSAKTETLACWLIKQLVIRPGKPISCMVVKRSKARKLVDDKILPKLPRRWLKRGRLGIRRSQDELALIGINGARVDFLSGKVVDDARGDGVAAAGFDEEQLIPAEAIENSFASLSEDEHYQTLSTCTALANFEETWEANRKNPLYRTEVLSILENDFLAGWRLDKKFGVEIPKFVESLRAKMDPNRFVREVGKFVEETGLLVPAFVAVTGRAWYTYVKGVHAQLFADARKVLQRRYKQYPGIADDITRRICWTRFEISADYIIGMDFNVSPLVAIVYKVLRAPDGISDIVWAGQEVVIEDDADAAKMAVKLIDVLNLELNSEGRLPAVIIPDASGRSKTSRGGRSSIRMLREEGFVVFAPSVNPHRIDTKNALNTKLQNARGDVTMFVDPVGCPRLSSALQRQMADPDGKPAKDGKYEHFTDAAKYPIAYLWPAALRDVTDDVEEKVA